MDTKARLEQVLLEYIERVIKKETATVAEIEALPQIAAVLVRCINWGKV